MAKTNKAVAAETPRKDVGRCSYVVLKYRHCAAAGEVLNVGLLLYWNDTRTAHLSHFTCPKRLEAAFAGFDAVRYAEMQGALRSVLAGLRMFSAWDSINDAGDVMGRLWPDRGTQYFAGPTCYGIGVCPDSTLRELSEQLVLGADRHWRRECHSA